MDLLYWDKLNTDIKSEVTKKQYFGRYLWRMVYSIPRVHVVTSRYIPGDLVNYVIQCKEEERLLGGRVSYSHHTTRRYWSNADEILLGRLKNVVDDNKDKLKFRTESDLLQVYAESEQDLKDIATEIDCYQSIQSISGPKLGTEDALRNGTVFMSKINYKYKVVLRDGNYDPDTKNSILMQLQAHDDIKIPPSLQNMLKKKYPALWGGYFYCNDDGIATFLSLMSPGIIGKIHTIDHLQ